jgi:CheY-like chemotaxis protein
MALSSDSVAGGVRPRVLCVDDDHNIGETVQAILGDEGYDVTCLFEITDGAIRRAIGELKPDCVLLDSSSRTDYGPSWGAAAWIHHLARSIPVVMFSAHLADSREALANLTERAQEAGFAAVILKPFSIDQLVDAVSTAVGRPRPLDPVDVEALPLER